ncbi:MAG TPA: hypothetical protein VE261_00090 [Gaiellaceae bacterium]|nr:hypothetical protein [Gaiellaceae bacterium]
MRKFAAAATLCVAAFVFVSAVGAKTPPHHKVKPKQTSAPTVVRSTAITYGVAEDATKYNDNPAPAYNDILGAGMSENRWTLLWDGQNTDGSTDSAFITRSLAAKPAGVNITLALYPNPSSFTSNGDGTRQPPSDAYITGFCNWAKAVATRYAGKINSFIVLNEPNLATFWPATNRAQTVEQTLAACYDAIKGANPSATIAGLGLSARKPGNGSDAPLDLLDGIAAAYKATPRTTPLFDTISVHPYPPQDASINPTQPPDSTGAGYASSPTFVGANTLQRVVNTVNNDFAGTGQPTFNNGLTMRVDEYGYQVKMTGDPRYHGTENSTTVPDQATQAADYTTAITKYFACYPFVSGVFILHLIDEPALGNEDGGGGWQSGLEEVDGTKRASYTAVKSAISAGCLGLGPTFVNGPQGDSGSSGSTGSNGKSGSNGKNGKGGSAGAGSKTGKSGKTGKGSTGKKGKTTVPKCKKGQKSTKAKPCK